MIDTLQPRTDWEAIRTLFEMARADADDAYGGELTDEACELYGSALGSAEIALLHCAAPDPDALAYKLEVFRDQEGYALVRDAVHEILGVMIADARRLAKEG